MRQKCSISPPAPAHDLEWKVNLLVLELLVEVFEVKPFHMNALVLLLVFFGVGLNESISQEGNGGHDLGVGKGLLFLEILRAEQPRAEQPRAELPRAELPRAELPRAELLQSWELWTEFLECFR